MGCYTISNVSNNLPITLNHRSQIVELGRTCNNFFPYGHFWFPYRFCPTEIASQVFCLCMTYAQPLTLIPWKFTISLLLGFCDQNSVIPTGVCMLVDTLSYMSCITSMYLHEIPLLLRLSQMMLCGMLSYAFSRSTNTRCKSFFRSLYFSISLIKIGIASVVDLPGINPNWFSLITVSRLILFSITHSHSFIVCLRSLIPL